MSVQSFTRAQQWIVSSFVQVLRHFWSHFFLLHFTSHVRSLLVFTGLHRRSIFAIYFGRLPMKPFISLITSYLLIYIERKRSYTIVPLWLNRCDAKKVNVYRFYDYRLHPWPSAIGHRFIGLSHCNLWKYENKRYNYHLWLMENTCGWSPMVFNALHTGQVTTRDRTELMNWLLLSMLLKLILRMASKPNRIDRLSPNAYDNCKFYGKNIDGINQCIKDVIAWLY